MKDLKLRGGVFTLLIVVIFSGCASKIMEGYIGKDIRTVVLDYGPPENAFDMGDGTRAFQWIMRNSRTTPTYVSTTGSATTTGNMYGNAYHSGQNTNYNANYNATTWMNSNTVISGGHTIYSKCIYTLFAKWNDEKNGWIVTGYKKPKLSCE